MGRLGGAGGRVGVAFDAKHSPADEAATGDRTDAVSARARVANADREGTTRLLIFDVPMVASRTDFEIEIVDTAGNEILKGNGIVKEDHLTFPIRRLAAAAYWVRVYQRQPAKVLVAEYGLEAK